MSGCRARLLVGTLLLAPLLAVPARAQAPATDPDCLRTVRGIDLQTVTVPELQAAMAAGRLTSVDLVRAYQARIAAYDLAGPKLNAVRVVSPQALTVAAERDAERAAGHVRGPLHGIPVLLKDNIGTTDVPTTAGSIALEGSIPLHEATLTERLRAAGAVILGKANLSEFANWVQLGMPNGYSSLGGQVVNAYNGGDPSGSSSGSGVAGSMAFATLTFGTETSGSIISPSEANSLVGVKPTVGLVSRAGVIPLSPAFDTAGPMARTVTDAAVALGAVAGPDPRDPKTAESDGQVPAGGYLAGLRPDALTGVRLGYSEGDASNSFFAEAMTALTEAGATLVPIDTLDLTSAVGLTEIAAIFNEFKYSLNVYLAEETVPDLRVRTLSDIIAFNEQHPDKVKYGQNLLEISDATPGSGPLALAQTTPTILTSQAAIEAALLEGDIDAIVAAGAGLANIAAAANYPHVIVPMGYDDDGSNPEGLAFVGTAYADAALLGYAYAYEQRTRLRTPPTVFNPDHVAEACPAGAAPVVPVVRPGPEAPAGPLPATGAGPLVALAALGCAALATACAAVVGRGRP